MVKITQKKCVPCEGIGKALDQKQIQELIKETQAWKVSSDSKSISRDIVTKNFVGAVDLINKIKDIAEDENHHPDLHLTSYKKLRIELSTHALGGLSENDFIVAGKIDQIIPKG